MKIVEYKVVESPVCPGSIDRVVNEHIKNGWSVLGEPHFVTQHDNVHPCFYFQLMVKYEDNEPSECDCATLVSNTEVYVKKIGELLEENDKLKAENLLLRETSKPRDNALLSSIDTIEMLDRIIYAFVANNYRYDEEEGYWIVLNNNTFGCNDTARNSFVKIINQIKEKYKNENNN